MDCNFQRTPLLWIVILFSVFTLTESQSVYSQDTSAADPHSSWKTRGNFQSPLAEPESAEQPRERRRWPVMVNCYPNSMEVVVQADMFESGLEVDVTHLRLGSEAVTEGTVCGAFPSGEAEFTIRAHLTDCGTKLSSTTEKIIYSNVLVYSPEPSSDGLLRLDGTTIPLECHYDKRYALDAISLHPTWVPHVSRASAEDQIDFSLLLMTDDWRFGKESYSYFVGDPIRFEVSAITGNHTPLRVYTDHCFATSSPDADASLRYDFIEHHGCLVDAYLTNSTSHFLQRVEEHKLRFQLDAFRFYQEAGNQIYITCYVKAIPVFSPVSSQNRACSLIKNRWRSIDGNDEACRSCDASRRSEELRPNEATETSSGTSAWPSMMPQEGLAQNVPEQHWHYSHSPPGGYQSLHSTHQQSYTGLMKREAEHRAGKYSILISVCFTLVFNCVLCFYIFKLDLICFLFFKDKLYRWDPSKSCHPAKQTRGRQTPNWHFQQRREKPETEDENTDLIARLWTQMTPVITVTHPIIQ
ncbi:uncharacterized protein V6R79_000166 [Siganus canaliculatus]